MRRSLRLVCKLSLMPAPRRKDHSCQRRRPPQLLPHTLGFQPKDSIVLVTLTGSLLGATLRMEHGKRGAISVRSGKR
jgi:hypothetical protein